MYAKDVAWLATEDERKHEPGEVYRIPLYDPSPTLPYGPYGTAMSVLSLGFLIGNFLWTATLFASVERRPAGAHL
jgi:hypothetical protein